MSFLLDYLQERDALSNVSEETQFVNSGSFECEDGVAEVESNAEQKSAEPSEETEANSGSPSNKTPAFKSPPVRRSKKMNLSQTEESPSTSLMKYITKKHEDDNKSNHLIDAFLSGIGETIKTFPPIYQHMAKSKIFNIVSDIEMQLLAPPTSIKTNPLNIQTSQSAINRFWSHQYFIQNQPHAGNSGYLIAPSPPKGHVGTNERHQLHDISHSPSPGSSQ
jgi:hypothetical protein